MREHRGSFRLVHARHSLYIIIYIRCACAVCVKPKAQAKCVFYAMCGRVINTYLYCTDTQHVAKRPISQCKTAHIATRFGPFRKPVWYGMFGHHGRTGPWWGPAAYAKIYHKGYNYWQNVGCDAHTREKVLTFLNISYHIATWRYTARCAYVLSKICCKTCILETDC